MAKMVCENYCQNCDTVLHTLVDEDDFYNFKVGAIRCDECGGVHGTIVMPCNECRDENGNHYDCSNCPWKNSKVVDAMTDKEYMLWCKENEPKIFEMYKGNSNGTYYHEVIKEIENEESGN